MQKPDTTFPLIAIPAMLSALGSESLLPLSGTAGIKVFQTALNKDYGADLVVDGIFGLNTDKALGKHYVTSGECQYMVTAAGNS